MANLSQIKTDSNWGDTAATINQNFTQVNTELTTLKNTTSVRQPLFSSVSEAKQNILSPYVGQLVLIGSTIPAPIYRWNGSSWVDTGQTGGSAEVPLSNYYTKEEINQQKEETDSKFSELEGFQFNGELSIVNDANNVYKKHFIIGGRTYLLNIDNVNFGQDISSSILKLNFTVKYSEDIEDTVLLAILGGTPVPKEFKFTLQDSPIDYIRIAIRGTVGDTVGYSIQDITLIENVKNNLNDNISLLEKDIDNINNTIGNNILPKDSLFNDATPVTSSSAGAFTLSNPSSAVISKEDSAIRITPNQSQSSNIILQNTNILNNNESDEFLVEFYAKSLDENKTLYLALGASLERPESLLTCSLTNTWTKFSGILTVSADYKNRIAFLLTSYNSMTVEIKDFSIKNRNSLSSELISLEKYITDNAEQIVISQNNIKNLEGKIFSENYFPLDSRLDSNTVLETSDNVGRWFPFRNATLSIEDDAIKVETPGSSLYEGIRYNINSSDINRNVRLEFDYKSSISNNLAVFLNTNDSYKLNPTNEWLHFSLDIDIHEISFERIQICNLGVAVGSFLVKNANLTYTDTIENRLIKLENSFLNGKKISVITDSIGTIYNNNTPYFKILDIDVAKQIESYVTWYDVYQDESGNNLTNKTIGGVTLTKEMIGTLQTFTPLLEDVGKELGVPLNYNASSTKVWSEVLCEKTGATLLCNAAWSGSAMNSGQVADKYKLSHAWSDFTIKRCRRRNADGSYTNPDIIIITRGTNDFSHSPIAILDDIDLSYGIPNTDLIDDKYSFRIAYMLTIKKLREAYPNAYIYCATLNVFKRGTYDVFPVRNNLYTLPQMNNVIREIANTMGCGLIEFDKDGITFENCYPEYISDSATTPTHPNSKGHEVMANKAIADIKYYL